MQKLTPNQKTDLQVQTVQVYRNPAYRVSFDFASWLLADARYAYDHGEEIYFNPPFRKEKFLEKVRKFADFFEMDKHPKVKIEFSEGDGEWVGKVASFENPEKFYNVRHPKVETWQSPYSILKKNFFCDCVRTRYSTLDDNWYMEKHSRIFANLLADLGKISRREIFGSSSYAFKITGGVINQIGRKESYPKLQNHEINGRFKRDAILKEVIATNFWS